MSRSFCWSFAFCIGGDRPSSVRDGSADVEVPADAIPVRVKKRNSYGQAIAVDAGDPLLAYKVHLDDDGTTDWFSLADVEVLDTAISLEVKVDQSSTFLVPGLKLNDPLSSLYALVAKELGKPQNSFSLSIKGKVPLQQKHFDLCLGLLGVKCEDCVTCTMRKYEADRVRIETVHEIASTSDGSLQEVTIAAVIYGDKGTEKQQLLWATQAVRPTTSTSKLDVSLSNDHSEVKIVFPGEQAKTESVDDLLEKASAPGSLWNQLQAKFGDEPNWGEILGRLCRRIT